MGVFGTAVFVGRGVTVAVALAITVGVVVALARATIAGCVAPAERITRNIPKTSRKAIATLTAVAILRRVRSAKCGICNFIDSPKFSSSIQGENSIA